jgi:hypothetical protein
LALFRKNRCSAQTLRFVLFLSHPPSNGFGSVCFAKMALVHFVLHKWVWFTLFCRKTIDHHSSTHSIEALAAIACHDLGPQFPSAESRLAAPGPAHPETPTATLLFSFRSITAALPLQAKNALRFCTRV